LDDVRNWLAASDQDGARTDGPGESFYQLQQTMSCDALAARLAAIGAETHLFEADFGNLRAGMSNMVETGDASLTLVPTQQLAFRQK
jgi:hypothetical protein